jgi:molecular chaperone DnaK
MRQALADAKLQPGDIDKIILVGGPTRMPMVKEFVERFMGKPPERGVDPMECVAIGAAIQGAIIAGEVKDILLLDVTPLSLGIETLGGIFTVLIERNTTIPTRKSQIFTTAADFQTSVEIHVLQGERPMAKDNISLGRFILAGIPPAPRGVPQIEVTYDIDVNGILHVTAKDLGTGKEQKITITAPHKLTKEEIEAKIKEAERFAEEDKRRKEEIELINDAESLIYTSEKTLEELKEKVPPSVKEKVEGAAKALREALEKRDMAGIKARMDELRKAVQEVGAAIYQQAQQTPPSSEEKGEKKEETVDTEYKVTDEEKKG